MFVNLNDKVRIITEVILSQGTNVYISPELWRKTPERVKELMLKIKVE